MANIAFVSERMLRGFGVDLLIHSLASEFCARGHTVTVYASALDDSYSPRPYKLDQIPTRATSLFPLYESRAKAWAAYVDAGHHDAVIIQSFPFFRLMPELRTPTIVVDAGVSPTTGMPLYTRANFRYLRYTQQHRYFPKASALVTISDFIRTGLPQGLRAKASVVYCGVDHYGEAPLDARNAMRATLGIEPHNRVLLYVGRLNPEGQPYKGTRDILNAARHWRGVAPDLRVVMAGRGSESDAATIRDAGAIPLLETPHENMAALYAAADVYLTASQWEGFDLPIMEAACQGVPTVALDIGAHPEIVRNGETGVLAQNVHDLTEEARHLVEDVERTRTMGEAAKAQSAKFSWKLSADRYEGILSSLAVAGAATTLQSPQSSTPDTPRASSDAVTQRSTRVGGAGTPDTGVTAIILNYGANADVLRKCVVSLYQQTTRPAVILVDNKSVTHIEALDTLEAEFPDLQVLRLDRNYGFAGGMNRGVEAARSEFVLLLNNDVTLDSRALEEMQRVIRLQEDVVGVAPKILLESFPEYFDAVGNLIDATGTAFNMGIGQLDIGQYDRIERTFGACFAAVLLKRDAFDKGKIGPLDERFFMYYEDVDWCFRAGVLGLKFLTAPGAVVHHTHSMTTRQLDYSFKYRLIMRNFLWTVARNFYRGRALRVFARTSIGLARNSIRGPYRVASMRALIGALWGLPSYLAARSNVQNRRRTQDQELFDYSHGERPYFNPITYQPIRKIEVLEAAYRRLALISGEERHRRIADGLVLIASYRLRFDRDFVRERLADLLSGEPERVQEFLDSLEV